MSIIQLLKALAFGVRMLCNQAELTATICTREALKSNYLLHSAGRCARVFIEARVLLKQWGKSNQVKLKQGLIILCSGREFSPSSWLVREVVRGLMRLEKKKVLQFINLDSFSWVNFFLICVWQDSEDFWVGGLEDQHFLVKLNPQSSGETESKIRSRWCSSSNGHSRLQTRFKPIKSPTLVQKPFQFLQPPPTHTHTLLHMVGIFVLSYPAHKQIKVTCHQGVRSLWVKPGHRLANYLSASL